MTRERLEGLVAEIRQLWPVEATRKGYAIGDLRVTMRADGGDLWEADILGPVEVHGDLVWTFPNKPHARKPVVRQGSMGHVEAPDPDSLVLQVRAVLDVLGFKA